MMRRILAGALLFIAATQAPAQKNNDFDPFSASIEENIATPAVASKASAAVSEAMAHLRRTLAGAGYDAAAVRSGEVVMVSIPCSSLFAPNSRELSDKAHSILKPLYPYISRDDNYKVILAVHSDDTGDEKYADELTEARASSIDKYFTGLNAGEDTSIVPYGLGADEPVAPNSGVTNRARNRRVEIYFVPTASFIDKARKKK